MAYTQPGGSRQSHCNIKARVQVNPVLLPHVAIRTGNAPRNAPIPGFLKTLAPWNGLRRTGQCFIFLGSKLGLWFERSVMQGPMDERKRRTVALGRLLVGAANPAGCSHTRLFVVFRLRGEEGYFPEPERRISIAKPPSPAAHMTSKAGKPPKTSRTRHVRDGGKWGETAAPALSSSQQRCSSVGAL